MSIINYYVAFAILPPKLSGCLERAPVPVPRDTSSKFGTLGKGKLSRRSDWSCRSVLGRIGRRSARSLAIVSAVPNLVFLEAMFART